MWNRLSNLRHQWRRQRAKATTTHAAMQRFLSAPSTSPTESSLSQGYLVLDLEMTGLDPHHDVILSAGWVLIDAQQIHLNSAQHIYLQHTDVDLDQSAPIHKIHHQQLMNGQSIEFMLNTLLSDLQGRVLVLHHAPLDLAFLSRACAKIADVPLITPIVDTLQNERKRLRLQDQLEGTSLRLDDCRQRYNLPQYRAHNAVIDAIATAELWLAQLASAHSQHNTNALPLRYFLT